VTRRLKQWLAILTDACALPAALWCAFALRLGEWTPEVEPFVAAFVASALIGVPVFAKLGLYRQIVRYMGGKAVLAVVQGAALTAVALSVLAYMMPLKGFPRSVPVIFFLLTLVYVGGTRFAVRSYIQWLAARLRARIPVVIYGAGRHGAELARTLRQQGERAAVAFVDDDPAARAATIDGVPVHAPEALPDLLRESGVREVLVAVPSSDRDARKRILERLEPYAVHVQLIPDIADLLAPGGSTVARDVEVEDLLGREIVAPLPRLLHGSVRGQGVLVTGAGGSIGSELCRQILRGAPRVLLLLDQSEFGLYEIHRELKQILADEQIDVPTVALLGSVTDAPLLRRSMTSYRIDTVYHAAAYKHVSLVERNVIAGIKNNTFGTLYTAEAAVEARVKRFILISTDKAVRTTNVMGASKRLAELVLQAMQVEHPETVFSMVRFGNVLGSSGSVVPLFLEQIRAGGPVTVTDPEATRFFMTIPEAAQLVLQAASLARGGDVFLLDMGAPVRILDLARRMIRLKGLTVRDEPSPDGDIEIRITGLAPGEKLHEELLIASAAAGTEHRKILRAEERFLPWSELRGALNTLEQACDTFDYDAIKTFVGRLVEGADLAVELADLTAAPLASRRGATVTVLPQPPR
jgi:FlaA1/EpsC-like NDP-sugar epimerase